MATTNTTFDSATRASAKEIKLITFAKERMSRAQAKVSKFRSMGTKSVSLDGGNFKLFDVREPRKLVEKGSGLIDTPVETQQYERRALYAKVFHMATRTDIGDLVDSGGSVLADAGVELDNAIARSMDEVILSAIITPAQESADAALTDDINSRSATAVQRLTAGYALTQRTRVPFYHKEGTGSNVSFTADVVEDINHIFAVRDVEDDLCATLTPSARLILAKDSDFKNAENIFSLGKGMASDRRRGWNYKGINWVEVSQNVLPVIDRRNSGASDFSATSTVASEITFASVKMGTNLEAPLSYTGALSGATPAARLTSLKSSVRQQLPNIAGRTNAALSSGDQANIKTVTTKSSDVIYVWGKSSLLFAERSQETIYSEDSLPMVSLAKQGYIRVSFGATLLDDAYAVAVPIKGTFA